MLKERQVDVAKRFRVSAPVFSKQMSGISKNSSLPSELLARQQEKENSKALIRTYLESLVDSHAIIDSNDKVRKGLEQSRGHSAKIWEVRDVMRKDIGLRRKKIMEISLHENYVRNLVLR